MTDTIRGELLPVLPLRDIVVFPHMIVPLFVGREKSVRALEAVMKDDKQILLVAQKNAAQDDPGADDLYQVGTVSTVLQLLKGAVTEQAPVMLLGTAFNCVNLLDHLSQCDLAFALPPGSRIMETGGYKGRSRTLEKRELHALISKHLGIPASHIVSEYGMSELNSQAYDCAITGQNPEVEEPDPDTKSRAFRFPLWARARVVSPETGREVADGETGLLQIFDLANTFSVLAVQTEDLAVRRGNRFELLGRAAPAEPRGCSLMSTDTRT